VSVTLDQAVRELRVLPLADPRRHLKERGRQEVLEELARWRNQGLLAHVLVVDPDDSLSGLLDAWAALQLDERRDLLLIFNTRECVARGWGLAEAELRDVLASARPRPGEIYAQSLTRSLAALGEQALRRAEPRAEGGFPGLLALGGTGVLLAGAALGLALRRRSQLAKSGLAQLDAARSAAEHTYTELMLACEELPEPEQAAELQLRATELKRRLDLVVSQVRARPESGHDPVRIGELRQLEDELVALRSTALQRAKESP
jgi:hypothetical protein